MFIGLANKKYFEKKGQNLPDESFFAPVDLALSNQLVGSINSFICYLSLCTRLGHLCITLNENIVPELPDELFVTIKNDAIKVNHKAICKIGNRYYFQRYWLCESKFIEELKRLMESKPTLTVDPTEALEKITDLNDEQRKAIQIACNESLSVICGGPGTGKTYTAAKLIEVLQDSLKAKHCRIVLAAPTGKAAANLQKNLSDFSLQATTLHKLLQITPNKREATKLLADVILIDESSMIDVEMMAELFFAVKTGARLILLGDHHQLPPVEAGSLFSDLIQYCSNVGELKQCLRAEKRSLVDFAQAINQGDKEAVFTLFGEITKLDLDREALIGQSPFFHAKADDNISELLQEFVLLSPLRKGPFGVDALNASIREHHLTLNNETVISPIMITQNDPRLNLYNGDLGALVNNEYFYFPNHNRIIPQPLIHSFEFAYCLSVHKSQGSEFNRVLCVLPPGSEVFGREIFYTAATRAKQEFTLMAEDKQIVETIAKTTKRLSGLKEVFS